MKRLCLSFYNVNILQLNVAMWGRVAGTSVVMHLLLTLLFQLGISELL